MVFPENVLFDFVLLHLEEEIASYLPPPAVPLPCDRWLARSCLQKATRRGEVEIAHRALATLLEQDRYAVWRHLIIIGLEDVGVPEMDLIARVVAAGRSRSWRKAHGGEWAVASFLVKQMAAGRHCQAACDLLLRAIHSPSLEVARMNALESEAFDLANCLTNTSKSLERRAVAALALGGGLAQGQRHRDAAMVFEFLGRQGYSSHVVATCQAAWTSTRNEMALLLPLVWESWMAAPRCDAQDDLLPRCRTFGQIPEYAIDQFTRAGGLVAQSYLKQDDEMRLLLDTLGVPRRQQPRIVGDLLFLAEGGLLKSRAVWALGDRLRLPYRSLPGAVRLEQVLPIALTRLKSRLGDVSRLRSHIIHQGR